MAQRLCFEERTRIEAACAAGFNATEIAVSLGRHPTTVQRELARGGGACGYEARAAQRACEAAARRPRTPKLAAPHVYAQAPKNSSRPSPQTKAQKRRAGPTSKPRSTASRSTSVNPDRRGSDPATNRPTGCCSAAGCPTAPTSTSEPYASPHRRQPQPHATQTTQLEISTHHIHSPKLQPPLELADLHRNRHRHLLRPHRQLEQPQLRISTLHAQPSDNCLRILRFREGTGSSMEIAHESAVGTRFERVGSCVTQVYCSNNVRSNLPRNMGGEHHSRERPRFIVGSARFHRMERASGHTSQPWYRFSFRRTRSGSNCGPRVPYRCF